MDHGIALKIAATGFFLIIHRSCPSSVTAVDHKFCGVFGFSIMFNSSIPMAATAAFIGAIANTLRLELVNFTATPAAVAAFIGALTAGLLASIIKNGTVIHVFH